MNDLYIIQDSALNQKDMIYEIENYVRGQAPQYTFFHNNNYLFTLYFDKSNDNLIFGHRIFNINDITNPNATDFHRVVSVANIKQYCDRYNNCYIMSPVPGLVTDQNLLTGLGYYSRNPDGSFINCETAELVVADESMPAFFFSFATFFKVGTLPIYTGILNSAAVVNANRGMTIKSSTSTIIASSSTEYLKNKFFTVNFTAGVEQIIGKKTVFVNEDTLTIELFTNDVKPLLPPNLADLITVSSNIPFTLEGTILTLDLSNVPSMTTGYLCIKLNSNEFLNNYIFESQKTFYDYNIYKV
jgi:hypothetical protein